MIEIVNLNNTYCVKQKVTPNKEMYFVETKNNRTIMKSTRAVSPHFKTRFVHNNIEWELKDDKGRTNYSSA